MTERDETSSADPAEVKAAARALRRFLSRHGSRSASAPAPTAVVEYLGRAGARIVAVGADGRWGDVTTSTVDIARQAVEQAGVELADGWERELTARVVSSPQDWLRMGRAAS